MANRRFLHSQILSGGCTGYPTEVASQVSLIAEAGFRCHLCNREIVPEETFRLRNSKLSLVLARRESHMCAEGA